MNRLSRFFLIAGIFLLLPVGNAVSQVVVYRFDFTKSGPSINYGFYDQAWVIADATGGPASWALTFRDGAHRRYITIPDFGSLFYPNEGKTIAGVISAAAADGTPQTTFLAIGDADTKVTGGNVSVEVPSNMEGYAQSADDESDVPFDDGEGNRGYAGISRMKGGLERGRTNDSNTRNFTVEEALADLVDYLERRGFTEFVAEDEDEDAADGDGDAADGDGDAAAADGGGGGGG